MKLFGFVAASSGYTRATVSLARSILISLGPPGTGALPSPGAPTSMIHSEPRGPIRSALTRTKARAASSPGFHPFQRSSGKGTGLPFFHSTTCGPALPSICESGRNTRPAGVEA